MRLTRSTYLAYPRCRSESRTSLLRAVQLSQNQVWDLFSLLDVIDERSIGRLLERGAVRHVLAHTSAPSIDEFLAMQLFIEWTDVLEAVAKRLAADPTRVARNN